MPGRTIQLLIELDPAGVPIAGNIHQPPNGHAEPFTGWLQLTEAIERI